MLAPSNVALTQDSNRELKNGASVSKNGVTSIFSLMVRNLTQQVNTRGLTSIFYLVIVHAARVLTSIILIFMQLELPRLQ
jgi:hypothetical protein